MSHVVLPITSRTSGDDNDFQDVAGNDIAIIAQVNGSLDSDNLADNAVATAKILDSAVTSAKIEDNTIVTSDIALNTITGANIAPDAIGNSELGSNVVTSAKIAVNTITGANIAADAIGTSELASGITVSAASVTATSLVKLSGGGGTSVPLQMDAVGGFPATPPAGHIALFGLDPGAGAQQLVVRWADGSTTVLASNP